MVEPGTKQIAENRRARFDYDIEEVVEAGVVLRGSEVKSLRSGKINIGDSYAAVDRNGEMVIYNVNIPEYLQANRFNHEEKRPRKLLLHAREVSKLAKAVQRDGMSIIPLRIYFNSRGRVKIAIGLGRGKKLHDKRESEKVRDWQRDKHRLLRGKL